MDYYYYLEKKNLRQLLIQPTCTTGSDRTQYYVYYLHFSDGLSCYSHAYSILVA